MKAFKFRGEVARQRREELGLRARDVAEIVGIATGSLLGYERGASEPSAPVYKRICEALRADPADLRELRAPAAKAS